MRGCDIRTHANVLMGIVAHYANAVTAILKQPLYKQNAKAEDIVKCVYNLPNHAFLSLYWLNFSQLISKLSWLLVFLQGVRSAKQVISLAYKITKNQQLPKTSIHQPTN